MKILVIHQYYLMAGQPGGSRFNEFAHLWADAGHTVTVFAGTVNHTTGETPTRLRGRWLTHERDGEVSVVRCHVPQSYGRSHAGRMWAFLAFTLSSTTAVLLGERPDVVIATSPPLVTAIPGWVSARLRHYRLPFIFEVRDLWPESAITTGVLSEGALLTRSLHLLERAAYWSADRINVLTPAFRTDISRRRLADPAKIVFVPNGADTQRFRPGERENEVRAQLGWGERFVVMYSGAHGRANALGQLLDAAERLRHRRDILIACVGDGPERTRLEMEARSRRIDNLVFYGPQPKERMPDFVNAADVGAAVLQNNPTFRTVYPNKVFDYMACARPVLLAIGGVARELVCEEARAGIFVEPESPDALAAGILDLAEDADGRRQMGERGRAWVLENATRESLAERYLAVMRELVGE